MSNENLRHFETLNKIDVSGKIEKKKIGSVELNYLSWAWAWGELKKIYPYTTYEVEKFNGLPYVFDPFTGYMVYTKITIENITHEMWLPVIDGANKAMKDKPYEYTTTYGKKTCEAATMFDINKTIMRCLVKNIAMFGLGLYIFAGEDLPEDSEHEENSKKQVKNEITFDAVKKKLLGSTTINELQINFKNCFNEKLLLKENEVSELINIKNNMKVSLTDE